MIFIKTVTKCDVLIFINAIVSLFVYYAFTFNTVNRFWRSLLQRRIWGTDKAADKHNWICFLFSFLGKKKYLLLLLAARKKYTRNFQLIQQVIFIIVRIGTIAKQIIYNLTNHLSPQSDSNPRSHRIRATQIYVARILLTRIEQ